jgi:drug/metabolite transporter (DMT)-like permease
VSRKLEAYSAAAVMCLIFGSSYIAMKIALRSLNPMTIVFSRYTIAAILLYSIYYFSGSKEKIKKEDLKGLIFLCLLEPGLFFIFDAYGLKYTTAIRASILLSTIPILTAVVAALIIKEKLTPLKLLTTLGSIAGVAFVISSKEGAGFKNNYLFGDILILGACISAAFYMTYARKMSFRYSFFTITRFQSLVAVIFFLPLAAGEVIFQGVPSPTLISLVGVVFLGAAGSAIGYLLLNFTISRLSAANAAIFSNLIPVVTMALSAIILSETVGIKKIIGLLIILSFIFILSWGERKNDLRAAQNENRKKF